MTENTVIVVSPKAKSVIDLVSAAINNSPTKVSFFSIRNYENKEGEIAHYLFNIGINYEKSKIEDIATLRNLDITTFESQTDKVLLEKARTTLIEAFVNPNEARSKGQTEAYTTIIPGVKVHNENGLLYIYGYRVKKEVVKAVEYKKVNSAALTLAKNELKKLCKTAKFRMFTCEVGNTLKAAGDTVEL